MTDWLFEDDAAAPAIATGDRSEWATPAWLFDELHGQYHFTVDACARASNTKLERYWSPENDGLAQSWSQQRVFCNPPYGVEEIPRWLEKAQRGGAWCSVVLLPVRTETAWWHRWVLEGGAEIRFIRGRVQFEPPHGIELDPKNGNRPVYSSCVAVYGLGTRLAKLGQTITKPSLR